MNRNISLIDVHYHYTDGQLEMLSASHNNE